MKAFKTHTQSHITRRQWGQWVLTATAGIALAACGGGGGGSDTPTLRQAFDSLQPGMTKKQAYELVGRTPSASSNTHFSYQADGESLYISFAGDSSRAPDDYLLRQASWGRIGMGEELNRGYL